jgi:apolipoprotein D and lipocalin family protein
MSPSFQKLKRGLLLSLFAVLFLPFSASAANPMKPLPTVPKVDVSRYMGKWHEVARLPMFFQRGCIQSTAEYALKADGTVSVTNRCLKSGKPKQVRGTATVVDVKTNAVLEVRFNEWFSMFIPRAKKGNYFIVWLAPDYSAAAVGTPSRKCLWILAREPSLPVVTYHQIIDRCRKLGFPVDKLIVEQAQAR